MNVDFSKWIVVAYNDNGGTGSMAQEIKKSLGIRKHLVCQSNRLPNNTITEGEDLLFDENTPLGDIEKFIIGAQALICIEHVGWHTKLCEIAKKLNIKVVMFLVKLGEE